MRPSIVLLTLDTLRADHSSTYGYHRRTTPRLEEVQRAGVQLDVAYAPMATTTPSHATMFTALEPRSHHVMRNGSALSSGHVTLAEILTRRGYRTAAFVSSFPLDRRFGLAQGFATYDDRFEAGKGSVRSSGGPRSATLWEGLRVTSEFDRRGDATRAKAVSWLEVNGYLKPPGTGKTRGVKQSTGPLPPFFLWVHLFDPHAPYDPPPDEAALFPPEGESPGDLERQIARYDAEIHFADRQVGALLDRFAEVGILDDVLVVVAGDHGEGLMEHGWMFHGVVIYEEQVRVPLLFRWPKGLPGGRHVAAPAQLLDLAPTILDLAGIADRPPGAQGVSLARVLRGEDPGDIERPVFLERRSFDTKVVDGHPVLGEKAAVRVGRWKYIEAPRESSFELFDLGHDPHEIENLHASHPETVAALRTRLRQWRAATGRPAAKPPVRGESARRLRALGYVQ